MADKHEDKAKKNIKALKGFRLKGRAVEVGEVVAKEMFAKKGEWQNLCNMTPPKAEETSDAVGKPKARKKNADGGGLPGAGG